MIAVNIVAVRDGNHPFSIETDAKEIPGLASIFCGSIHADGVLRKHGDRFFITAEVSATACLICDRSLEEFEEEILTNVDVEYIVDHVLAEQQHGRVGELDDEEVRGIRDEDKVIDITDDVRQVLVIGLPFKRVAPAYRDKSLEEIFPMIREKPIDDEESTRPIGDQWAALEKLKRS